MRVPDSFHLTAPLKNPAGRNDLLFFFVVGVGGHR